MRKLYSCNILKINVLTAKNGASVRKYSFFAVFHKGGVCFSVSSGAGTGVRVMPGNGPDPACNFQCVILDNCRIFSKLVHS